MKAATPLDARADCHKSTFLAKKDGFDEQAARFVPVILLHVEEARARARE